MNRPNQCCCGELKDKNKVIENLYRQINSLKDEVSDLACEKTLLEKNAVLLYRISDYQLRLCEALQECVCNREEKILQLLEEIENGFEVKYFIAGERWGNLNPDIKRLHNLVLGAAQRIEKRC